MSPAFLATAAATLALLLSPLCQAQQAAPAASATAPAKLPADAAPDAAAASATEGKLAHYGRKFAGRKTASGERFDPQALTMAHKTLPFGTRVRVTNLQNNKSVVVRINDRGPATPDRIGDVSTAAASKLRMLRAGVVKARLEVLDGGKTGRSPRAAKV